MVAGLVLVVAMTLVSKASARQIGRLSGRADGPSHPGRSSAGCLEWGLGRCLAPFVLSGFTRPQRRGDLIWTQTDKDNHETTRLAR